MLDRVGNLDQLAGAVESVVCAGPAAGCRAIDLRAWGGVDVRVLPDRGLDLGTASFAGLPLAWVSPVGECAPLDAPRDLDWVRRFGGGLMVTCGLRNVGAPSEGHGQHGEYSHQGARAVRVQRGVHDGEVVLAVHGLISEVSALGDVHLEVARTITTRTGRGLVEIVDVTTNRGSDEQAAPLLYHVNLGVPLWDDGSELILDARRTVARDEDAEEILSSWRTGPGIVPAARERVLEHEVTADGEGWSHATVRGAGVEMTVGWDAATLPRMHQWVHPGPGMGVLGLEPANCSVLGRGADRAAGRLPMLAPGEARTTRLRIAVRALDA